MRSLISKNNQVHLAIWVGLGILFNVPVFREFSIQTGLISIGSSLTFLLWIVFSHMLWALPDLLSSPKKYFSYIVKLIIIASVAVGISALTTSFLLEVREESGRVLQEDFLRFCKWMTFEVVMLIIISSLIKFSFDFFKLKAQQGEIENQKLEVELKYLKLQINPHFLFNTLNNLLLLTNKKSPKASVVVEKLAYMMRYLLEKDKKDNVPLAVEIEFLKSYIELEEIRIKDIDVSFDIEGDVQGQQLPPALLMTLIENAFKHGVKKSDSNNYVHIELKALPKEIHLKVVNPFHSKTTIKEFEGIGLENLRKRLDLIYGDNYSLEVGQTSDGTFEANLKCATL